MEHRLSAVGVRIHHEAVPPLRDAELPRQVPREAEEFTEQARVLRLVEGGHVMRGDHENVRGRLRIEVREGQHAVTALHDRRRDLAGGDAAKHATPGHVPPSPKASFTPGLRPGSVSHRPKACRSCSQNCFPVWPSADGLLSIFASCSSRARCSAVSLTGVQTCTRTWRSPRPPSPTRGSPLPRRDRKSTRLNSSHTVISYAVFCLKKKKIATNTATNTQKQQHQIRQKH